MATTTAANGVIKVGSADVAEVTGYSIDYQSDTVEDTVIGDTARTYKSTLKSFTASLDVQWDPETASNQDDLIVGTEITFQIYPEGEASGDTYYTGSGIVTGRSVTSSVGEMVTASFTVQGSGDLTTTTV
jgi:hypothetical protein